MSTFDSSIILAGGGTNTSELVKSQNKDNMLHKSVFPINEVNKFNEAIKDSYEQGKIIGEKEGISKSEKKINYISTHIHNELLPYIKEKIAIKSKFEFKFKNFNTFFSIRDNFQYTINVNDNFEYNLEYCTNSDTSSPIINIFITMDDLIEELLYLNEAYSNLHGDILI